MNNERLLECIRDTLEDHALLELITDSDVHITDEYADFFSDYNQFSVDEFKPVIYSSFNGYSANSKGKGYISYKVCLHSLSGDCRECFFHFMLKVANCCNLTLRRVSSPTYNKPVHSICATLEIPLDHCSLCVENDDQDDTE